MSDHSKIIQQQIAEAVKQGKPLSIHGAGSHSFMLPDYTEAEIIDMTAHHGIIDYQPTELTVKARTGTTVAEIQQTLSEQQQRLATDFPLYDPASTLGGAVSIGYSGSSRPFHGAIRDHILGAGLINGAAEHINCGGQVMKNVAGYDISRLLAGSRGTLGAVLDITLKVLPLPEVQQTVTFEMDENSAIQSMNKMAGMSLPISACAFHDGQLYIRLEGTQSGVNHALKGLGGEVFSAAEKFWNSLQNQSHPFFSRSEPLWRIIVPATTPPLELESEHQTLLDWCGGLRWVHADEITQSDFMHISNMGGYIENHRGASATRPQDLMSELQRDMHKKIKQAFDPGAVFNPSLSIC